MKKKIIKAIKIIVIAIIIISLILSMFVSQDTYHLDMCEVDNCLVCAAIQIAQAILVMPFIMFICVAMSFLIHFYLSRIRMEEVHFMRQSLIFQKVQFNE